MITLDGITFSGDMSGQKKLAEHRKKYYTRVVTGYRDAYDRKYTGPHKAGGQGWVTSKIKQPTYGYIRNQTPLPQASAPAPAPAPAPKPAPAPRPQPVAAPPAPTIKAPTASSTARLTVANRPTTVSGPSMAEQIQSGITKGIDAFKKSEATRLAKIEAERKAAEEKKRRAEAIAARPNTVEGQQALKITKNIGAQLPGMGGFEGGPLSTIRSKLLNI